MNEYEQKIVKNIEDHNCHVTSVFDKTEVEPNFTYSVGIPKSAQKPEIIILGLDHKLAHSVANNYCRRVIQGEEFKVGEYYGGFLQGFSVVFSPVSDKYKKEYMLSACWYHGSETFDALQLIYPSTSGVWPWESDATENFKNIQPSVSENIKWQP